MKKLILLSATALMTICATMQAQTDANVKELANRNTAFAIDLYEELKTEEGNLFFSPYSISTALAMTHLGARGETEKEMTKVLHFPANKVLLNSAFSKLQKNLNGIQKKKHVKLSIANSLWGHKNATFLDVFIDMNLDLYNAKITNVDFGKAEESCKTINTWVEDKTNKKIQKLLKPDMVKNAILVLCNAIYFKGNWAEKFDKKFTNERDFYVTPEKPVKAPLMYLKTKIKAKAFDSHHVFELPYEGDDVSMVILLPRKMDGLKAVEDNLTIPNINKWLNGLDKAHPTQAIVTFPKFKTTKEFELSETLKKMGMQSAFDNADFSGMNGRRDLFISAIAHKAFIEVNEEGTEAAAATAVVMTKSAMPRLLMLNANHPFIFLIREKSTGSILFMGRINDPR